MNKYCGLSVRNFIVQQADIRCKIAYNVKHTSWLGTLFYGYPQGMEKTPWLIKSKLELIDNLP